MTQHVGYLVPNHEHRLKRQIREAVMLGVVEGVVVVWEGLGHRIRFLL